MKGSGTLNLPWRMGKGQKADLSLWNCQGCGKDLSSSTEISVVHHKAAKAESEQRWADKPKT
jgi:hypothetical protein